MLYVLLCFSLLLAFQRTPLLFPLHLIRPILQLRSPFISFYSVLYHLCQCKVSFGVCLFMYLQYWHLSTTLRTKRCSLHESDPHECRELQHPSPASLLFVFIIFPHLPPGPKPRWKRQAWGNTTPTASCPGISQCDTAVLFHTTCWAVPGLIISSMGGRAGIDFCGGFVSFFFLMMHWILITAWRLFHGKSLPRQLPYAPSS